MSGNHNLTPHSTCQEVCLSLHLFPLGNLSHLWENSYFLDRKSKAGGQMFENQYGNILENLNRDRILAISFSKSVYIS